MNEIWIVDFGSQYTQLITRIYRELNFKSLILTVEDAVERLKNQKPNFIVLSGGPQSVFEDKFDYSVFFNTHIPILGICYGMQLISQYFGGKVEKGVQGEYGKSLVIPKNDFPFNQFTAWMSHSDHVSEVPKDFQVILESENGLIAGIHHPEKKIWGVQFHPEVIHTEKGTELLHYFAKQANVAETWQEDDMLGECLNSLIDLSNEKVLCAFSGGVDSLVAASLVHKKFPQSIYCFFVDHGLLRPQDYNHIEILQNESDLNIEVINAKDLFLDKLQGVSDPEKKRKIIGNTFIEVFDEKVKEYEKTHGFKFSYLLQGTLYPDVIESTSPHKKDGKSVTIKSHHNVGGLPEKMDLKLLEPLRFLFKDEVRKIGALLDLKKTWLNRHPFPGPGLGIRILGEIDNTKINQVQLSDQIMYEELINYNYYNKCWQSLTVHLPIKTVGVKGDGRAYEEVICVRIIESRDGMTATWSHIPYELLDKISSRITNEVPGITRVVYDVTSKPPGTIEWE